MADIHEGRPTLPYGVRDRKSVGVLVALLVAVFAAIFFMRNLWRHHEHVVSEPVTMTEVPSPVPPPEPAAAPAVAPAAAAAAAPEAPEISARKQSEIARVISEGRSGLSACYQRALVRDSTLVHGNMTVHLSVAASGKVNTVHISGPSAFRAMDPCIKRAVSRWTFPTASAPYATEFPLQLRGFQ
jgi:hypothetical protein